MAAARGVLALSLAALFAVVLAQAPSAGAVTQTTHARPTAYNVCDDGTCGDIVYTGDNTVANCGLAPCHNLYHTALNLASFTAISEFAQGGTGPGSCQVGGGSYLVWAGSDTSGHVFGAHYDGGSSTFGRTQLPGTTRKSPACTVNTLDGFLYVTFVGTDSRINVLRSTNQGASWTTGYILTETSAYGVAIASLQIGTTDSLVIAWAGTDATHHVNWGVFNPNCSNHAACTLSFKYTDTANTTSTDVSLPSQNACNGNGPAVAWKGSNNANLNVKAFLQRSGTNSCYTFYPSDSQTGIAFVSLQQNGHTTSYFEVRGKVNGGALADGILTL